MSSLENMTREDLMDLIKHKERQISRLKVWRRAVLAQIGIKGRMSRPSGACIAIQELQKKQP